MSRSAYPYHLRSWINDVRAACGNLGGGPVLQWRSVKRVTCKNCLKLIADGKETKWFKPRAEKGAAK